MKPVIVFYAEEKDGKITITKEELQRIVDEAYRQGVEENSHHYYYTNPPTWDYTKITC